MKKLLLLVLGAYLVSSCGDLLVQEVKVNSGTYMCNTSSDCPPDMQCYGWWNLYEKYKQKKLWVLKQIAVAYNHVPGRNQMEMNDGPHYYGTCYASDADTLREFQAVEICDNNKDDDGDTYTDCDDTDCQRFKTPACENHSSSCSADESCCGNGVLDPGEECDNPLTLRENPNGAVSIGTFRPATAWNVLGFGINNTADATNNSDATTGRALYLLQAFGRAYHTSFDQTGEFLDSFYTCSTLKPFYEEIYPTPYNVSGRLPSCTSDCKLNVISCFYDSETPDSRSDTTTELEHIPEMVSPLMTTCERALFTPKCAGTKIEYCRVFPNMGADTTGYVVQEFCPKTTEDSTPLFSKTVCDSTSLANEVERLGGPGNYTPTPESCI